MGVPLFEAGVKCFHYKNSSPVFLLMILVVTNNQCLHLLFHYVLENGNFLFIVGEICSIAPFSILLLLPVLFFPWIVLDKIVFVISKNQVWL